ncbi:Uncharacterised protein [Algoriella xinjiangensis]|uniref:EpsG family protein n=1 Tax=Algoriella xinjiangensis TaxID=684065 RepID=UPI000F634972|nr:EpsG family protein [Algoriella xinjiangensis]VDH17423.1 Uncharacterised protein [Algoriella xinjiangensis]
MIYFIVITYLIVLSISFDFLRVKGPKKFFYYFTLIIFILVAGLRWKVGGDSLIYQLRFETLIYPLNQFSKINFLELGWEPGYLLLNSIAKTIIPEFWFFQLIQAIFVNVILFDFFKKHTPYLFTSLALYAFFYYFYFNMEILREIIPICVFVKWMYPALEKGNYKKYYIINFIMLFFHTSSFILFLFPLFSTFKLNRKGFIFLGSLTLLFIIIFSVYPNVLSFLAFTDRIANKIDIYTKYDLSLNGMIYLFIVFGLFPYSLFSLNKKYYKKVVFEELIYPYFFIVAIYISYSGFARFMNYFGPFMIVYLVNTIYLVNHINKFRKIKFLYSFILILIPIIYKTQYYMADTSQYYKNTNKLNLWMPYSSIFNKEDVFQQREIIFIESMNNSNNNSKKREN